MAGSSPTASGRTRSGQWGGIRRTLAAYQLPRLVTTCGVIVVTGLAPQPLAGDEPAEPLAGREPAEPIAAHSLPAAAALNVSYSAGRLTLRARDMPLSTVLGAIGERTGIDVRVAPQAERLVQVDIQDVPVLKAIRRILEQSVWVMLHEPTALGGSPGSAREIRVYGNVGKRPPAIPIATGEADRVDQRQNTDRSESLDHRSRVRAGAPAVSAKRPPQNYPIDQSLGDAG